MTENQYTLIKSGSSEAGDYEGKYPAVKTEDIYVKKPGGDSGRLGAVFGRSAMTLLNYIKENAAKSGQSAANASPTEGLNEMDLSPLYEMQPMLDNIPPAAFEDSRAAADRLDESILRQVGVVMAKQFYNELGVDTGAIRIGYIIRKGIMMLLLTLAGRPQPSW